jgi:predicted deacylase
MAAVSTFFPADFLREFSAAARAAGFSAERFGQVQGYPLAAYTKSSPTPRPRIYLSAGIHGDEPAPPRALLQLLQEGSLDDRYGWSICPLLNPAGMAAGTRENRAGLDLNRDYRALQTAEIRAHVGWLRRQMPFDLTLCLHEDWESPGFYLYELNPDHRPSLAEAIVEAVRRVCPLDRSATIDGRPARGGIIRPDDDPTKRELWPEAIYLRAHLTRLSYTLETPSARPEPQRIKAHTTAITTAVQALLQNAPPRPA